MLDKILGVLAIMACVLLCFVSWLYQDAMAQQRREEEQEETINHAAAEQDDDVDNNRKPPSRFPSDVTMVSFDVFLFFAGAISRSKLAHHNISTSGIES